MADFQESLFGRTSAGRFQVTVDEILLLFSPRFENCGRWTSDGQCWTRNGTEYRSSGVACSLSEILEANVPQKYFLSPTACKGILRRAEKRERELPRALRLALQAVAESTGQADDEKMTPTS